MGVSEPPPRSRTSGEARVYTAEEVGDLRTTWERDQREQNFQQTLSRLEGQYQQLPDMIEATARRIFQEMWTTAQQQAAQNHVDGQKWKWRQADTLIAFGQLTLAAAVLLLATHVI